MRDWIPDSRAGHGGHPRSLPRGARRPGGPRYRGSGAQRVRSGLRLSPWCPGDRRDRESPPALHLRVEYPGDLDAHGRPSAQCPAIERVVVASSDKAYGDQPVLPYTEEMPLQGRFPYDVSKSCSDLIALSYFHTWKVPVAVTRCGNLFGGGDLNYNRLIPGTIRSVVRGEVAGHSIRWKLHSGLCLRARCGGGVSRPRRTPPR